MITKHDYERHVIKKLLEENSSNWYW